MATARVSNSELSRLAGELERGTRVISIAGLTSVSAKAFVLAELHKTSAKKFAIITDSNSSIDTWECDLAFWADAATVVLPSFDTDIYSGVSPHAETQERRALAFWQLTQGQPDFLLMSARSLIARTVSPVSTRQ